MSIINQRIKELREESGLAAEKVAELMNSIFRISINESTVLGWEADKDPTLHELRCIAVFFKASSDFILALTDKRR